MKATITLLPGDGIGPEVVGAAKKMLDAVATRFGHDIKMNIYPIGGSAIDLYGNPLPDETLTACGNADAILLGAVGGPKWDDPAASVRPEQGLLGLRKELGLFANLRPVKPHAKLLDASPLRSDRLENVNLMIVRELTGGIYFGEPRLRRMVDGEEQAVDTMVYTDREVQRVAHLAFQLASERSGKVTSVDKANVLETSRLWRQNVEKVAAAYPAVELEHLLVDAAAMHLLTRPASFDVIVTANLFGDILTDEASVLTGSMGNMPSASLGETSNQLGRPRGMYEPIHGSAPDIAGQGVANPIGTILSTAMMLRHSLGLEDEAASIEAAVDAVLGAGDRTSDIVRPGETALSTDEMTIKLIEQLS